MDLDGLVAQHVELPAGAAGHAGANVPAKVATVLAGMLADADSIADLDVLRAGGTGLLFDDLRAPSTVGTVRVRPHVLVGVRPDVSVRGGGIMSRVLLVGRGTRGPSGGRRGR